jgi:hypothetical protein
MDIKKERGTLRSPGVINECRETTMAGKEDL